jgi:NAD(P)-dependent dehydrogenase (short-subunit alcohol dehydrogenase family)
MKKTVLITGCSNGIGRAVARLFKEAGWIILGIDIKDQDGVSFVDAFFKNSVTDSSTYADIKDYISSTSGSLDCVVNNAAIQVPNNIKSVTNDEWLQTYEVNVLASINLVNTLLPFLKANGGSVVNVSSVHAIATSRDISAYAVSKGIIESLTRSMAVDYADDGIRVNSVIPGAVDTSMLRESLKRLGSNVEAELDKLVKKQLIKRVIQPDDVAKAVYFLALGDTSSMITGQKIVVDAGATSLLGTE